MWVFQQCNERIGSLVREIEIEMVLRRIGEEERG